MFSCLFTCFLVCVHVFLLVCCSLLCCYYCCLFAGSLRTSGEKGCSWRARSWGTWPNCDWLLTVTCLSHDHCVVVMWHACLTYGHFLESRYIQQDYCRILTIARIPLPCDHRVIVLWRLHACHVTTSMYLPHLHVITMWLSCDIGCSRRARWKGYPRSKGRIDDI